MLAQNNMSGMFALLVFLDFKSMNNLKRNTANKNILNVPFHVLHDTHYAIFWYFVTY
jgi:hypothetical protein